MNYPALNGRNALKYEKNDMVQLEKCFRGQYNNVERE